MLLNLDNDYKNYVIKLIIEIVIIDYLQIDYGKCYKFVIKKNRIMVKV